MNRRMAATAPAPVYQQAPPPAAAPAPAVAPPPAAAPAPDAAPPAADVPAYMAELEQLASLRDAGILTDEEFEAKKRKILGL